MPDCLLNFACLCLPQSQEDIIENLAQNTAYPWYVQVEQKVYGPYDPSQMLAFIREGRIIPDSLVSQNPTGTFGRAGQTSLFRPMSTIENRHPTPSQPMQVKTSVFLVMAEINSEQAMRFLHLIQRLGTAQRIGDTVWLLRAAMDINALREQLSASLSRQDRLFILDSFNNKSAWHNIGADMDERIRKLWDNN